MSPVNRLIITRSWVGYGACFALFLVLFDSRHVRADTPPTGSADGAATTKQVQLDVVVARVGRGTARLFASPFLKRSEQRSIAGPSQSPLFGGMLRPSTDKEDFQTFLQGLEQQGLAKVLAQPRLVTLSGNPGSFQDEEERTIPAVSGQGKVPFKVGMWINLLPTVLNNGRLHLDVDATATMLSATSGPSTQRIQTMWELKAGESVVIGGLAHGGGREGDKEGELILLVTPHIVQPAR